MPTEAGQQGMRVGFEAGQGDRLTHREGAAAGPGSGGPGSGGPLRWRAGHEAGTSAQPGPGGRAASASGPSVAWTRHNA